LRFSSKELPALEERSASWRLHEPARVPKAVYWLAMAWQKGQSPAKVLDRAVALAGYKQAAGKLTQDALLPSILDRACKGEFRYPMILV
jgi:hypothetical protein